MTFSLTGETDSLFDQNKHFRKINNSISYIKYCKIKYRKSFKI